MMNNNEVEMAQHPGLRHLGYTREGELNLIDSYNVLTDARTSPRLRQFLIRESTQQDQMGLQVLDINGHLAFPDDVPQMAQHLGLRYLGYTREGELNLIDSYNVLTDARTSPRLRQFLIRESTQQDQMGLQVLDNNGNLTFPDDVPQMAQNRVLRAFGYTREQENSINEIYSNMVGAINRPRTWNFLYNTLSERERFAVDILVRQNRQNRAVVIGRGQNNMVQNNQPEQNNEGENNQPEQNNNAGQDVLPRRNNQLVQNNSQGQIAQQTYPDSDRASRYSTTISSVHSNSSDSPSQHMNRGRK